MIFWGEIGSSKDDNKRRGQFIGERVNFLSLFSNIVSFHEFGPNGKTKFLDLIELSDCFSQ
mgnify:CR=1 FL=1